ncbi:MAG: hypothetical protein OXN84_13330 [Albidovulum sp.]|nr:hypothetical protein [Albidovulum sp.]
MTSWQGSSEVKLGYKGCAAESHVGRKVGRTYGNSSHTLQRVEKLIFQYYDDVFNISIVVEAAIGAPFVHVVEIQRMHEFLIDFGSWLAFLDPFEISPKNQPLSASQRLATGMAKGWSM